MIFNSASDSYPHLLGAGDTGVTKEQTFSKKAKQWSQGLL